MWHHEEKFSYGLNGFTGLWSETRRAIDEDLRKEEELESSRKRELDETIEKEMNPIRILKKRSAMEKLEMDEEEKQAMEKRMKRTHDQFMEEEDRRKEEADKARSKRHTEIKTTIFRSKAKNLLNELQNDDVGIDALERGFDDAPNVIRDWDRQLDTEINEISEELEDFKQQLEKDFGLVLEEDVKETAAGIPQYDSDQDFWS